MFIVYTYAAVAKLYPDWFNGEYLNIHFSGYAQFIDAKYHLDGLAKVIGSLEFAQVFSWCGFFFDLLIVPIMLWSRTRSFGLKCAIFFHVFNSIVFGIGIFPFFALAMMIFFYDPTQIQEIFFKNKSFMMDRKDEDGLITTRRIAFSYLLIFYVAWQIYLPLRHYHIPGNVFWTEEGHRLSWRMMLRARSNDTNVYVAFPDKTGKIYGKEKINLGDYLTAKQASRLGSSPDMIWQFAKFVKEDYKRKGKKVMVFIDTKVSINQSEYYQFTNPNVDLAKVKWRYFGHQPWIKPQPKELNFNLIP